MSTITLDKNYITKKHIQKTSISPRINKNKHILSAFFNLISKIKKR